MTEAEKKLLQAQHRLEEAQARDRVKERKMRTRRLIQEGAILEKVLPEVQTIELSELEGYLSRKLGKQISISDRRSPGSRGPPSFFSRKGALTHHPKGQWYFLRKSCALRGGCGCCGSLQTMPQHLQGAAVIVCAGRSCFCFGNSLHPARTNLPPAALFAAMPEAHLRGIFSFAKEKQKKEERGEEDMAIYHLEAKVVSRGAGRSAVAASAYLSCSRLYNDYDGIQHDYTKKQGLVWQQMFLPEYAPQEWQDREKLWNAVEEVETAKDSRLAREFVVALPIELNREQQIELLQDFIREQFVSDGMCADAAIHDTDGHNPHAHILLTVRPLDEQGRWQYKTEKEYLCMRNGEERGFTAAEFRAAQNEGWEKQYPYKVGKKKVYMTPSAAEAQGLIRADKHPKSTRYGRQNPISERWNSEEQLVTWRAAWADVTNLYLERAGRAERIDHRSNAARGLDEQPTIHEGVTARALERKGIIADRCEINRQIKADNALLRELKAAVRKLAQAVKNTLPVIAEAMEKLRANMIVFRYQLRHIGRGRQRMKDYIHAVQPNLVRYTELVQEIRGKGKERKSLLAQKKETPLYLIPKQCELSRHIAELTEELEELKSEKDMLLHSLECSDDAGIAAVKKDISTMEAALKKLSQQEEKYTAELNDALQQYADLKTQSAEFDPDELQDARLDLRPAMERSVVDRVQSAYGDKYDYLMMYDSKRDVADILHEETEARSIREHLRQKQQAQQKQNKKNSRDTWER